jgi:hypothetical protein
MFNHDYPDKETNTTSARFLRSQLEAMGLDTILQCTESLEQSYIAPPTHLFPTRDRSVRDNTDFVFVIPVERESANAFFFDGLDSGPNSENVTINGIFVEDKDRNKYDNYYVLNRNNDTTITEASLNKAPPMIFLVSDTFWLFTSDKGGSVEYDNRYTWDELFKKNYPQLYSTLMKEYVRRYV